MTKVVLLGVTYYEVNLGGVSFMSFDPQELVVRMAKNHMELLIGFSGAVVIVVGLILCINYMD